MAKSRGYLTHSNSYIFILLKALNISFTKFADSPNVFDQTCDDFFQTSSTIKFSCPEHQNSILSDIWTYYAIMRMR